MGWWRSVDVGLGRLGRSSLSRKLQVKVSQDFPDGGGLGDESDHAHFRPASTGQRVDLVDTVGAFSAPAGAESPKGVRVGVGSPRAVIDELGPSLA